MVAPKRDSKAASPSAGPNARAKATAEAPGLGRSKRDKLRRVFQVGGDESSSRFAVPDRTRADGLSGVDVPGLASPGLAAPGLAAPGRDAGVPGRGDMRAFLQARKKRLQEGLPATLSREVVTLPDADVLSTEHGPLWRRELRYPISHVHGRVPLERARCFDRERLAKMAKSPSFTQLAPEDCLFLDTETTGLSGGAGTMVFAYGIAFFEGDELVLEQLFLRDFGEEPAMLHHIKDRMLEHPVPVTFVGKSYDRHRIAARLAVHKIKAPVLTDRHLDLYHVIRRQFGKHWPDSRLRTAEERLLGLYRDDDLPGSEAPAAFLDWIRDGTGPVDRVLEHNRLDVLSLAALLGVVTDESAG